MCLTISILLIMINNGISKPISSFLSIGPYWNIPQNCTPEPVLLSKQRKQSGKKAEFFNEGEWN